MKNSVKFISSVLFISFGAFIASALWDKASASEASPSVVSDIQFDMSEIGCLAKNIYFESGIEETAGKVAVALVTLNRVANEKFPNTICEVVHQANRDSNGNPKRNQCQFSWYCDGKKDTPFDGENWQQSQMIAWKMYSLADEKKTLDITDGALYYHATYVTPYWAKSMKRTTKIGSHIFYR